VKFKKIYSLPHVGLMSCKIVLIHYLAWWHKRRPGPGYSFSLWRLNSAALAVVCWLGVCYVCVLCWNS